MSIFNAVTLQLRLGRVREADGCIYLSRYLDVFLALCLRIYVLTLCVRDTLFSVLVHLIMGNEGSLPSDTESQASDWQSVYSYGSRAGRRSSLGSMRIPSPMEPPEPDLSHLSPEEVAKIQEVMNRAKSMKQEETKRIKQLEEDYIAYANDVERRASEAVASASEFKKESPLCPICLKSELKIKEGQMKDGQNVCVDCGNLTCLRCGNMEPSVTSKELEWVCHVCHKRRQLVLSTGLWYPGCDVDEDIPLAKEVESRLQQLEERSAIRGPLKRSASVDTTDSADRGASASSSSSRSRGRAPSLQRQLSLPDYKSATSAHHHPHSISHGLEVIQETGHSDNVSANVSPEPPFVKEISPTESDEMKKSTGSVGGGSIRAMGVPSSRSESEYSDGASDVDMEDGMIRSGTDGISPDEGSDDYSFMSIGSSDDNSGIRRKHRPMSLNLSRSISATSSEDETSDSAISTDGAAVSADSHELRIALAAKGFVEDMRGVDMVNDTDEEVAEITAAESIEDGGKVKYSPSAPVSPSWREGLESPPFSPRRRDSYPGKRRGSSPVSPKDKRFTYSDISPPRRQLSDEKLYDKDTHGANHDQMQYPQSLSPNSPDDPDDYYGGPGEMLPLERPTSSLKKSKPFYSLEDATEDDTPTVMDLATYAATVASNTANLTSLTASPTNIVEMGQDKDSTRHDSPESMDSSSPVSPTYYDNVHYGENEEQTDDDIELADPSQKSIDYQGSKRQKARPPTTDWSPVIDLSPILDVSPSLEEAEQAEMLAQQQAERERQASREDEDYSPVRDFNALPEGVTDVEYVYYGLKRYEVVEDISELLKQNNNGMSSPDVGATGTDSGTDKYGSNYESEPNDASAQEVTSDVCNRDLSSQSGTNPKGCGGSNSHSNGPRRKDNYSDKSRSEYATARQTSDNTNNPPTNGNKIRRKLPEPNTSDVAEVQKPPIPKPRRKDRPPEPPPGGQKSNPTSTKSETREPSRNAPILVQNTSKHHGKSPKQPPQKQDSEERQRTGKNAKAKPDTAATNNNSQSEDAPSLNQYRVLESPPSPENKSVIRREYSDSTSVSPSSSPDREIYLYPSPVTPPDSDSSPPKPHSPSSGTDFEEELMFTEATPGVPKSKHKDVTKQAPSSSSVKKNQDSKQQKDRHVHDRVQAYEKELAAHQVCTKSSKQSGNQTKDHKDHKQKDMKKVRRKLPPIPSEDEQQMAHQKPKQRPVPSRKPAPRSEHRRKVPGTSSDDSSMNEDDKEVASITRKKAMIVNDLDKPSLDKRNGNYITQTGSSNGGYRKDKVLINIPPDPNMALTKLKSEDSIRFEDSMEKYFDETDEIIDSMINIYGAPITNAMKGLKRRLQDELRRVTEGRRKRIDEIDEIRVLKFQLVELRCNADKSRSSSKGSMSVSGSNGKKRSSSNSRTSPQLINRRARHKRQSSDPMVSKFSPIKEDKDIESEMQIISIDSNRSYKTADDSSQSGVSDTDSTRSEPILNSGTRMKKVRQSDYTNMFYSKHAQSTEQLDVAKSSHSPHLISSHSEGNIPLNGEDAEVRLREEKRRELQFEIEKRKKQLAEREAQLKQVRSNLGATSNKQLTQSCDEISMRTSASANNFNTYIPPRPIPTGIIKPIDDEEDSLQFKTSYNNQGNYSSSEYLAHKQEELMMQRIDDLSSFSTPFLYTREFNSEKSAFVPQYNRTNLDSYSYSTGDVNLGKDTMITSSATLPNMTMCRADLENNNRLIPDAESSPPYEPPPTMPLLSDVKARSRKIIHDIGSGSRPVSAEFNVRVEDLMNGMYRVESDNSVDADEPIMKHMMEGGVTILKNLERKKQFAPSKPKTYNFPVKRILLTTDPKEKHVKGRQGNGIGMKIIGGKSAPETTDVGAYVAAIYKGGVADQLHGEVNEGDQILEWNGIELTGKSYEEVQQIIAQPNGEIELVIRSMMNQRHVLGDTTGHAPSCHSSYDNIDSDEETDAKARALANTIGVDPNQLAAKLEGIEEDESPSISHSSSQQDYNTASASSGCSSPLSEPTSTSSDNRKHNRRTMASSATATVVPPGHQRGMVQGGPGQVQQGHMTRSLPNHPPPPYSPPSAEFRKGQGHVHQTPQSSLVHGQSNLAHGHHGQSNLSPGRPSSNNSNQSSLKSVSPTSDNSYNRQTKPSVSPDISDHSKKFALVDHSKRNEQVKHKPVPAERQTRKDLGAIKKQGGKDQSGSFDDFLYMSKHAGGEEPKQHPVHQSPKKSLSASTSELAPRKKANNRDMNVEDDIKKSNFGFSRGDRQMGDIQLKLKHDDNVHVFYVSVIQARNLLPKDINGLSDPFVKIYLLPGRNSENKRRTKHISRTLNPEWNEEVKFTDVHKEELNNKTLEVTVWDYDRFKANDFLGEVVLDLSEDAFLDNFPHWYPLCAHDETKGIELPQPTVLPPEPAYRALAGSPRSQSNDRKQKPLQNTAVRNDRIRPGLGRRRRSFDTLQDVDKV